jgi:uncharacterized protein
MEASRVQEQIRLLRELQEIDSATHKIRQDRQAMEAELGSLAQEVERISAMVEELRENLSALQAERNELAQDLARERDNMTKAESRLPAIKTQKEYVAVLKEIDTAKKTNRDLEERIKAKDAEISVLDQEKDEKEQALNSLEEQTSERGAVIEKSLEEIDTGLKSRQEARAAILEQIPVSLRKRYQTLFDRRGGMVVVEARLGACQGCNMQLPPQVFNTLFRQEEVLSCPHCNRLIYLPEE